ncbi:MAG: lariocidin/triculamin family lasso peptide core domain [Actinomycetota bacterium]
MSKKSHPGDGVRNQGVKGGTLYGVHFGGGGQQPPGSVSILQSLLRLVGTLRRPFRI